MMFNSPTRLVQIAKDPPDFRLADGDVNLTEDGNRFLLSLRVRALSWRTVRAYGFDLVVLLRWLNEAKEPLPHLTQARLLDFMETQQRKNVSPTTLNRQLITCDLFYQFICDQPMPRGSGVTLPSPNYKGQGYDPFLGIHWRRHTAKLRLRVKVPKKIIEPLTVDEVTAFLRGFRHYRDVAIALSMAIAGLRSMEVIELRVSQVNLENAEMRVRGKGNKERVLPMAPQLVTAIEQYLRFERPSLSPATMLFVNLQGERLGKGMTSKGIISLFSRQRAKPNLAHANPHRFRHTFGADMARAGMQLPTLQKLMGHADQAMTLRYICLNNDDVIAEYNRTMVRLGERYAKHSRRDT
jgi:site-specific recombinase XerD